MNQSSSQLRRRLLDGTTRIFLAEALILPLALMGHLLLIPRLGAVGTALMTTLFAVCGALGTVLAVYRIWRVLPPVSTLLRSMIISGVAFSLAALWTTPGFVLLLKLPVILLFIVLAFKLSGEFSAAEITLVRSLFRWQPGTGQTHRF